MKCWLSPQLKQPDWLLKLTFISLVLVFEGLLDLNIASLSSQYLGYHVFIMLLLLFRNLLKETAVGDISLSHLSILAPWSSISLARESNFKKWSSSFSYHSHFSVTNFLQNFNLEKELNLTKQSWRDFNISFAVLESCQ